eukprot:jgi/Mesvir1/7753/Mv11696-RA.1
MAALLMWMRARQQKVAELLPDDRIDPDFHGLSIAPVAKMTSREFRDAVAKFDAYTNWKDAKTQSVTAASSDDPPSLRIVVTGEKIDVVEIVSDRSNGVPMQPTSLRMIKPMDVRTAREVVQASNAPTWEVVNGERLALSGADETVAYLVLKHAKTNRHKLVFFRAAVTRSPATGDDLFEREVTSGES